MAASVRRGGSNVELMAPDDPASGHSQGPHPLSDDGAEGLSRSALRPRPRSGGRGARGGVEAMPMPLRERICGPGEHPSERNTPRLMLMRFLNPSGWLRYLERETPARSVRRPPVDAARIERHHPRSTSRSAISEFGVVAYRDRWNLCGHAVAMSKTASRGVGTSPSGGEIICHTDRKRREFGAEISRISRGAAKGCFALVFRGLISRRLAPGARSKA